MIHLITGAPGTGKSLLAVELILENSLSETPRPIFSNINGLDFEKLRCFPLDNPEEWYTYPVGSMLVIDECQRYFPPRPNGSKVPQLIAEFETHRHHGLDIILLTQHPTFIDANIRKLVDRHQHGYRPFGKKRRTLLEWTGCNDNPEPAKNESNSLQKRKPFDPKLFQYYKSSSQHTDKDRTPWAKVLFPFAMLIVVVIGFGYAFYRLSPTSATPAPSKQTRVTQEIVQPKIPIASYVGYFRSSDGLPATVLVKDGTNGFYRVDYDSWNVSGPQVTFFKAGSTEPVLRVSSLILAKLIQE